MVDETLYKQYIQALDANTNLLERALDNLAIELAVLSGDALEQALAARYASLIKEYGTIAASAACDFYTQQRQLAQVAQTYGAYTPTQAQAPKDFSLFSEVGRALKKQEIGKILQELNGYAVRRTMEQADNTLIRNATIDPAHPRWAFVPRLGACAWCVFLGSQGFVYHSQSTVSASRHSHCKCSSVVDFDTRNPSLKGYNQAAMQDAYKKCRDAVIDDIDNTWAAMSKEEKEAYARTHNIRKGHSVFDVYQRNRIIQEMKTRDREWLRTGKAAKTTQS